MLRKNVTLQLNIREEEMNTRERAVVESAARGLMTLLSQEEHTGELIPFDGVFKVLQGGKNSNNVERAKSRQDNGGDTKELPVDLKYGKGTVRLRTRVRPNGSVYRYYEGRAYDGTKQISVTAKTQKEVLQKLKQLLEDIKSGTYKKKQQQKKQKKQIIRTYADWAPIWLKRYKSQNRHVEYIEDFLNRYILPKIGAIPLSDITTEDVEEILGDVNSTNTKQKVYDVINGSMRRAVDNRLVEYNPCAPLIRPKHRANKRDGFNISAQNAMLSSLAPKYKGAFFFLCCTGLRVAEFLALRYPEDFEDNRIRVCKEIDTRHGNVVIDDTKTGRERFVPYAQSLIDKTLELADGAVIFGKLTYYGIKKAFMNAIKENGLNNVTIHSTRHTFATTCYHAKVQPKQIQAALGHATLAMTTDVYTHCSMGKGDSPIMTYLRDDFAPLVP